MKAKSKWACIFSLRVLIKGGWAHLWTLTTPDEVDLKELSKRWRKLIWNGFTPCVRVFEKHPGGHGYHVHFVTAERLSVDELRPKAEAAGFGRIHVRRIPGKKAEYVAKYLTKQRATSPGIRMWSCVGFEGCKAKDVEIHSNEWDDLKMVMNRYPAPSGYNFYARLDLARQRLWQLKDETVKRDGEPDFEPTFPALYRRWKDDPYNSIGKPAEWWRLATTQNFGAAAAWWGNVRPNATRHDNLVSAIDPQTCFESLT
jgi:hypothetical protein